MAIVMMNRFTQALTGRHLIKQVGGYPTPLTLGLLLQGVGILSLLATYGAASVQAQSSESAIDQPPALDAPTSVTGAIEAYPSEPTLSVEPAAPEPALSTAVSEPSISAPSESDIDSTGYRLGATERSRETSNYSLGGTQPRGDTAGGGGRTAIVAQPQPPTSVQVGPVSIGSGGLNVVGLSTPASLDDYKRLSMRPPARLGKGNLSLIFPLAIPAPITSLFGWRVHPVTGAQRFHTGTDLGAPLGTPVLAAVAGRVLLADLLGGYGLTVALEHNQGTQQTLYGHLSEIFVKPGEQVKQGSVIGRVGSTGLSTGPHLHFEFRQLTSEGWVAMDAGTQLEYALAQLVKALEVAKIDPNLRLELVPPGDIGDVNTGAQG